MSGRFLFEIVSFTVLSSLAQLQRARIQLESLLNVEKQDIGKKKDIRKVLTSIVISSWLILNTFKFPFLAFTDWSYIEDDEYPV